MLPSRWKKGKFLNSGFAPADLFCRGSFYVAASVILFLSVSMLFLSHFLFWTVSVDGRALGAVEKRVTAKKVVSRLLEEKTQKYDCPVETRQEVNVKPDWIWAGQKSPLTFAAGVLSALLKDTLDFVTPGVALVVDGKEKLYLRDKATARKVLREIKDKYRSRGAVDVYFEEKVMLVEKMVPPQKLISGQQAFELLNRADQKVKKYRVQPGDTLWEIARSSGHSLDELKELNREVDPRLLPVGEEIKLAVYRPALNVVAEYRSVSVEKLPYPVVERENENLEFGERVVLRQGVPGRVEVTYCTVERNGEKVDKYPLKKVVKQKPLPRIVATGSKMVLASRSGEGRYYPVRGRVSSKFGYRGRGMHQGIDMAADYGETVVAMASGTVRFAGRRGGYGLLVEIDHGQGLVTRYAHLSSIAVSTGEKVDGGQKVGRVGASGNATGPHLHFEVRVNGEALNPLTYL